MLQDFNLFHSLMVMFFSWQSFCLGEGFPRLYEEPGLCCCLEKWSVYVWWGHLFYGTAQIPYVYPSVKLSSSLLKGYIKIPLLLLCCDFFPDPEHMVDSLFVSNENLWIEVVSLGPKYTHPKYVGGGWKSFFLSILEQVFFIWTRQNIKIL